MIDHQKQPHDGRPRNCYKCKASFVPVPEHRNARQCETCRYAIRRPHAAHRARPGGSHTSTWDSRSLGLMEAAALRMAWGPQGGTFVTGNCDE